MYIPSHSVHRDQPHDPKVAELLRDGPGLCEEVCFLSRHGNEYLPLGRAVL